MCNFADDMNRKTVKPRPIELLAPARDAATAIEAILHGADAVYIGAGSHGARRAASNSIEDIRQVVNFARQYRARVYVTVNTIIFDDELEQVKTLVEELYRAGVDALIVQDLALLEMDLPPIQLHASTQMDTRDAAKARWLQEAGFNQIVVARENSIDDIRAICDAVDVRVETFVHGALCVSYSGDCRAGWVAQGRSANRGECPQMCRQRYNLVDAAGNQILSGKHLLSLRDLNLSSRVAALLDAGVSSLKIEGRLKDVSYVKNAVAAYRRIIDRIIDDNPDKYCRASKGRVELDFTPVLAKGFNRGFTTYFIDGAHPGVKMASINTPKMIGERAGVVTDCRGKCIKARLDVELHNGDGLGFFRRDGSFDGFGVNRVEGNRILVNAEIDVPRGAVLYRNRDKSFDDVMARPTARRLIDLSMTLRPIAGGVALDVADSRGCRVSVVARMEVSEARTPQEEARYRVLSKLGDTIYRLDSLEDRLGDVFVPASALTALRRKLADSLDRAARVTFSRLTPSPKAHPRVGWTLTNHDNIANRLAERFYRRCGVEGKIERALETDALSKNTENLTVMTTKYCLRRELGYCTKTRRGRELPDMLFLESGPTRYCLDFDCKDCRMTVVANPSGFH